MDWFKHDSNANLDDKLQEVLLDYGLEGYGLYWYCIELIVGKTNVDNITFELKHDARIIARNTGSSVTKVEEMMKKFISIGLFENTDGKITCLKVAKRLMTSATSNVQMRGLIQSIKDKSMTSSQHRHDDNMPDKKRREENRLNTKDIVSNDVADCPHEKIIQAYHEHLPMMPKIAIWSDKRKSLLKARWREDKKRQDVDWWIRLFKYISKSDFLTGKSGGFNCSLEWILNSSNLIKIIEGNYENKEIK